MTPLLCVVRNGWDDHTYVYSSGFFYARESDRLKILGTDYYLHDPCAFDRNDDTPQWEGQRSL